MIAPPRPKQVPFTHREHGIARDDPYHWLKDRTDPDTLEHLRAENAFADAAIGTAGTRRALYEELLGRIQETDQGVPWDRRHYRSYTRTEDGLAYPVFCRRRIVGRDGTADPELGPEEVVLDQNALAKGHAFYDLGGMAVSPDQRRVAWLEDTTGAERFVLRVKDIASGADVPIEASDLKWGLAWAADGETLFVAGSDHASRPCDVRRVRIGGGPPVVVYREPDELFHASVHVTRDEGYVVVGSESKTTSEWWLLDAREPEGALENVQPRRAGVEYDVEHHEGRVLVRTNEGAKNFRLEACVLGADAVAHGAVEHWVPHRVDVYFERVIPFRRHLVFVERRGGLPTFRVRSLLDGTEHAIDFPEPVYDTSPERNPEFDRATFRFTYHSLVTPRSVFDYDLDTRERRLLKEDPIRGGYDRGKYASRRLFASSRDGAQVPVSIVYRKDVVLPAPLLLEGYGAYGMSNPVWFSSTRLSLLDRGAVLAIAHVRGGGELGRAWYDDGKLDKKQNTFDDFVAVADHLVADGTTTPAQLAIIGGSAGGLLVGAVLNQHPDRFCAVVAAVPFVDALNTMLDDQLPLTVTEYEEWGNPNERAAFDRIRAYAPYENVARRRYPPVLATAGLNDPRVGYWEAAKWIARLREVAEGGPFFLHTNMDAGHAGASGRYAALEELALLYTFLLQTWGRLERPPATT